MGAVCPRLCTCSGGEGGGSSPCAPPPLPQQRRTPPPCTRGLVTEPTLRGARPISARPLPPSMPAPLDCVPREEGGGRRQVHTVATCTTATTTFTKAHKAVLQ